MEAVGDPAEPGARATWSASDRLFHRQLAAMTGNPVLLAFADHVAALMDQPLWHRLRDDSIAVPGRTRIHAAEHRMIYEAIVDGDAEAAAFYSAQHINRVRTYMELANHEIPRHPARRHHSVRREQHDRRQRPWKGNVEAMLEAGVHGFSRHRHDGRGQPASARGSARTVVARRGRGRPRTARPVITGVSSGSAPASLEYAADAKAAGAEHDHVACRRSAIARTRTRSWRSSPSCPDTAFRSWPTTTPRPRAWSIAAGHDRADPPRDRRASWRSKSARATHAGLADADSIPTPGLEVLVGGDDWALEGFCAGATSCWVAGSRHRRAAREVVGSYEDCRSSNLDAARAVYRRMPADRPLRRDAQARPVLQGLPGRGRLHHRRPDARTPAAAERRRDEPNWRSRSRSCASQSQA